MLCSSGHWTCGGCSSVCSRRHNMKRTHLPPRLHTEWHHTAVVFPQWLDSLHQLSRLACKTQHATVLDFKLPLNIRHTADGVTPAGPGILCATCISWRLILTSDMLQWKWGICVFSTLPCLSLLLKPSF